MSVIDDKISSPDIAKGTPILVASGLRKTFRMGDSEIQVLSKVDLIVAAGEFIAIEGRSGSGKSTLLHLLGALDECNAGIIAYNGTDIAKLSSARRAVLRNTQFGFVFQFYHLLPELNVLENTLLSAMIENSLLGFRAKKAELRTRAKDLLSQMGLEHRLRHRPQQLSGGERQRVAIARALMNKPRLLFADEPTGNLDVDTGRQIMAVLERLHQQSGQTIVMVTHDRSLACKADRVMVLEGGMLKEAAK
jgi:lipoprotein-releasing system ATP-binding protein